MNTIDETGKSLVGFIRERRGDDLFYASTASGISKQPRVNTVAGDNPERI